MPKKRSSHLAKSTDSRQKIVAYFKKGFVFLISKFKLNKLKSANNLVFFLIISVVSIFAIFLTNFSWNDKPSQSLSLAFKGNSLKGKNFQLLGDKVLAVSDSAINIFDKQKGTINYIPHSFSDPFCKTNGEYMINYWSGGKKYYIGNKQNPCIYTGDSTEEIITASISSSGTYAIVTKSNDFMAELSVFNPEHKEIYKYFFSDVFISDVDIDQDGKTLILPGIQSEDGDIDTKLYVLNVGSTDPLHKIDIKENMISAVKFTDSRNCVAIGNNYSSFVNYYSGEKRDIDYEMRTLSFFSLDFNSSVVFVLSSMAGNNNYFIKFIDAEGRNISKFNVPHNVNSISIWNNLIAILADSSIELYNNKGTHKKSLEIDTDIKKILLNSEHGIYALTSKYIKYFQL